MKCNTAFRNIAKWTSVKWLSPEKHIFFIYFNKIYNIYIIINILINEYFYKIIIKKCYNNYLIIKIN